MNGLDPTSKLIIEEAQRRGIAVEILAPRAEYYRLRHSGRMLLCRESLSELATGVAVSRCDDRRITWRMLSAAGLFVPAQVEAGSTEHNAAFLREHGCVVVKPVRRGMPDATTRNVVSEDQLEQAIARASAANSGVLLEQQVAGQELHVVVIGDRVAAATLQEPSDGASTLTPQDVTDELSFELCETARRAARALELPVADVRIMISSVREHGAHFIIEVNERPELAAYETQPTAARFLDLLFPETATAH